MYTKEKKPKENKSKTITHSVAQPKGNVKKGKKGQGVGFVDNRTDSSEQIKVQTPANNPSFQSNQKKENKTDQHNKNMQADVTTQKSNSEIVQRWIKMGSVEISKDDTLSETRKKTEALFDPESKKPKEEHFKILTNFAEAKEKVSKALKFLSISNPQKKNDIVQISDVEAILKRWMGVPHKVLEIEDMEGDVLKEQKGDMEKRLKAGIAAEMRYYVTYEELAWALVQESGLQAQVPKGEQEVKEKRIAIAVLKDGRIFKGVLGALNKIYEKAGEISWEHHKKNPNYAPFHGIKTAKDFENKYKAKYQPGDIVKAISIIHDLKDYLANTGHWTWTNAPKEITLKREEKEGKDGSPGTFNISKETMRYNLGTVDEADPYILFMRERGRPVWAGPSYTTVSMLQIVKECGGTRDELTSVAYGIFALWSQVYPHEATPIHTFHEVMAAAQMYGVPFNPDSEAALPMLPPLSKL